jgi:hypothetical protein
MEMLGLVGGSNNPVPADTVNTEMNTEIDTELDTELDTDAEIDTTESSPALAAMQTITPQMVLAAGTSTLQCTTSTSS